MNKKERSLRILARGEISGHSHIITGEDVLVKEEKGNIVITVGNSGAVLKHLLETPWVEEGKEIWTEEHADINIAPGTYDYIPETNYDPLTKRLEKVID